jgi:hypothetical protein
LQKADFEQTVGHRIAQWTAGKIHNLEAEAVTNQIEIRSRAASFHLKKTLQFKRCLMNLVPGAKLGWSASSCITVIRIGPRWTGGSDSESDVRKSLMAALRDGRAQLE